MWPAIHKSTRLNEGTPRRLNEGKPRRQRAEERDARGGSRRFLSPKWTNIGYMPVLFLTVCPVSVWTSFPREPAHSRVARGRWHREKTAGRRTPGIPGSARRDLRRGRVPFSFHRGWHFRRLRPGS